MDSGLVLDFGGERLILLAGRAVHWPAQSSLLIADLHLGKGDVFRSAGIAVPSGGTRSDLSRLTDLIDSTAAQILCLLGDVLHGAIEGERWRVHWQAWRAQHPALRIVAISGNHDRRLAEAALDLERVGDRLRVGGLELCHAPQASAVPQLCGHLHPVVKLPRLPGQHAAFVLDAQRLILPAFSLFTGGLVWDAQPSQQLFVCAPGGIVALPSGTPRNPARLRR